MGNRAVICHSKAKNSTAIYVHWNGGLESVLAFLEVCRRRGYRCPTDDSSYGMARLCGLICEFFGGALSVGIGPLSTLDVDNYDNGAYLIGEMWTIKERFGAGSKPVLRTLDALTKEQRMQYDQIVASLTKTEE